MPQYSSNIPLLFGIAAASLATGYYLGQSMPSLSSHDKVQSVLKRCKEKAVEENRNLDQSDINDEDDDSQYEDSDDEYEIDSITLNDIPGEVRMALVIRQDLQMQKGKIAAQCCHAALSCFRLIGTDPNRKSYNPLMVQRWLGGGQAKITLKCPDKETMDELYAKALSLGVNATVIHDAGRTQIAAGSATVLGLGPAPKSVLDQITGELKLY